MLFRSAAMSLLRDAKILLPQDSQVILAGVVDEESGASSPLGVRYLLDHRHLPVQGAIYTYLGDLYPEAGMTPGIGDPLRGPYLRWLVFYAACFEPALVDKSANREPMPPSRSPYGDFETTFKTLTDQLAKGDRKSTRLNSSHVSESRMPSSA